MGNRRAHILIKGEVQGVFYRFWTKKRAESLGLRGWVKNNQEGQVEAVFEGPGERVEKMIKKCRKGSPLAKVEQVKVIWQKSSGEFTGSQVIK